MDCFYLGVEGGGGHTHILAHVNVEYLDDRYPKLKICNSELILDSHEYIPLAHIAMHCMI
jgi:hypothetical protein